MDWIFSWIGSWVEALKQAMALDGRNVLWVWGLSLFTVAFMGLLVFLLGRAAFRSFLHYRQVIASAKGETPGEIPEDKIDPFTVLVAAMGFLMAGNGMWEFFGDKLGLEGSPLRLLFLLLEAGALACALRVRRNIKNGKPAGFDWIMMWAITVVSGIMSSTEADDFAGKLFRFGIPIFAGIMWELALNGSRHIARERSGVSARERFNVVLKFTPKRLLARFGLIDTTGRAMDAISREHYVNRLALTSAHAHELMSMSARSWRIAMARRQVRKAARKATEHAGLGVDPETTRMLRNKLSVLRGIDALINWEVPDPWTVEATVESEKPEVKALVNPPHLALLPGPNPAPKAPGRTGKTKPSQSTGFVNGVPVTVREYWAERLANTGEAPSPAELVTKFSATAPTARRWTGTLKAEGQSALMAPAASAP